MRIFLFSIVLSVILMPFLFGADGDSYFLIGYNQDWADVQASQTPGLPIRYGVFAMGKPDAALQGTTPACALGDEPAGMKPYMHSLNVGRTGSLFITYLKDHSFVPKTYHDLLADPSFATIQLANLKTRVYDDTSPYGTVTGRSFLVDHVKKILFHQQQISNGARWDGPRSGTWNTHNWGYHSGTLQSKFTQWNIGYNAGDMFDYPHSYVTSSPNDGSPTPGGGGTEPWGQAMNGLVWIPNGVWFHQQGRGAASATGARTSHRNNAGINDPSAAGDTIHFRIYQVVDYEGRVTEWAAVAPQAPQPGVPPGPNQPAGWTGGTQKIAPQTDTGANCDEAQLATCGDPCHGANASLKSQGDMYRSPFELAVGPMGTVYATTPYDKNGVRIWKSDAAGNMQPDWSGPADDVKVLNGGTGTNVSPAKYIIKVPSVIAGTGTGWTIKDQISKIGFATRELTMDWVYVSDSSTFAVGDNFSGSGGYIYAMMANYNNGNQTGQTITQYKHEAKKVGGVFNHSLQNLGGINPNIWGNATLPNGTKPYTAGNPPIVLNVAADGAGNLYCFCANALGPWEWDSDPAFGNATATPNWVDPQPGVLTVPWEAAGKLRKPYSHLLWKVTRHINNPAVDPSLKNPTLKTEIAAGYIRGNGKLFKDKISNKVLDNLTQGTAVRDEYAAVKDMIRVDVAVVSDAGVEPSGENRVDIEPDISAEAGKNLMASLAAGQQSAANNATDVDYIFCEDLNNIDIQYSWCMENDATDYRWTGYPNTMNLTNQPLNPPPPKQYISASQYQYMKDYQVLDTGIYIDPIYANGLHVNILTQQFWQETNWEFNNNGFIGGWSNNVVDDIVDGTIATSVTNIGNQNTSIEYCWEVYLLNDGEVIDKTKIADANLETGVAPTDPKDYLMGRWIFVRSSFVDPATAGTPATWTAGNGMVSLRKGKPYFSYQFTDGGTYEIRLRARYFAYDYGAAQVMPQFLADPHLYIDKDGGNANGGWDSKQASTHPNGYYWYYCASKHGAPTGTGLAPITYTPAAAGSQSKNHYHTAALQAPFTDPWYEHKGITAVRKVIVGKKPPETGTFAAAEIIATDQSTSAIPEYSAGAMFKPASSGQFFIENTPAQDIDGVATFVAGPAEVNEDYKFNVAGHAFIKYWTTVDEKELTNIFEQAGVISAANKGDKELYEYQVQHDDWQKTGPGTKDLVADMLSGVIPGTVRFEWRIERGNGLANLVLPNRPGTSDIGGVTSELNANGVTGFNLHELFGNPIGSIGMGESLPQTSVDKLQQDTSQQRLYTHPYQIYRVPYKQGNSITLNSHFNIFNGASSLPLPAASGGGTGWDKLLKAVPRGALIAEFGSKHVIGSLSNPDISRGTQGTDPDERLFFPENTLAPGGCLSGEVYFATPSICRDPSQEFSSSDTSNYLDLTGNVITKGDKMTKLFDPTNAGTNLSPIISLNRRVIAEKDEFVIALYVVGDIRKYDVNNPIYQEFDTLGIKHDALNQGTPGTPPQTGQITPVPVTTTNDGTMTFDHALTGHSDAAGTTPRGFIVGFKSYVIPDKRIAQAFYKVIVHDTTAPIIRASFKTYDQTNGLIDYAIGAAGGGTPATTGDDFSQIIGITIEDNNPYWALDPNKKLALKGRYIITDTNAYDPLTPSKSSVYRSNANNVFQQCTDYGELPEFGSKTESHVNSGETPLTGTNELAVSPDLLVKNAGDNYSYVFLTYPPKSEYEKADVKTINWPWFMNPNQDGFAHVFFMATDPHKNGMWTKGGLPEIAAISNPDPVGTGDGTLSAAGVGKCKSKTDLNGSSFTSLSQDIIDNDPPELAIGFQTHLYESWIIVSDRSNILSNANITNKDEINFRKDLSDSRSEISMVPVGLPDERYAGKGMNYTAEAEDIDPPESNSGFNTFALARASWGDNVADRTGRDGIIGTDGTTALEPVNGLHVYYTIPGPKADVMKLVKAANAYEDKDSYYINNLGGWAQDWAFNFDQVFIDEQAKVENNDILGVTCPEKKHSAGGYNMNANDSASFAPTTEAFEKGSGFNFVKGDSLIIKLCVEDNVGNRIKPVLGTNGNTIIKFKCWNNSALESTLNSQVLEKEFFPWPAGSDNPDFYYINVRFQQESYYDQALQYRCRDFMTVSVKDNHEKSGGAANWRTVHIPYRSLPSKDIITTMSMEKREQDQKR